MSSTMGIDQYGHTYHDLGPHPRKRLMEMLCCSHVEKMYADTNDGDCVHTGYIISGLWITVCDVTPWRRPVI